MLEMLVVDRMRMVLWMSAIRIRSSAYAIGRPRCHSWGCVRWGMTIQPILWWLGVLLSVAIVIYVRIIIP